MLGGLSCWAALFIEPWLEGIEGAELGSAHWLCETANAMSECLHDWLVPTPSLDYAIDAALDASRALSASLLVEREANVEAARKQAFSTIIKLIDILRIATSREAKFSAHSVG
ncbi:hypothetical protein ACU4GR_01425 [Methylobacterium oryzae CBMB20]